MTKPKIVAMAVGESTAAPAQRDTVLTPTGDVCPECGVDHEVYCGQVVPIVAATIRTETVEALTTLLNKMLMREMPADAPTLAPMLDAAYELKRRASDLHKLLTNKLYDAMEHKQLHIENVGTWERAQGSDREKWEHREVALRVARKALEERLAAAEFTGGVVEMDEWEAVLGALLACAQIQGWRLRELRGRGIKPDDYRTKEPGRKSVRRIS